MCMTFTDIIMNRLMNAGRMRWSNNITIVQDNAPEKPAAALSSGISRANKAQLYPSTRHRK